MKAPVGMTAKADPLYRQGIAALRAGKLPDGIRLLKEALAAAPSSGDIHNDLATAYWQTGQFAAADAHYASAVRLSPKNAHALNHYGAFLTQGGRLEDAEKFLKRAEKLLPDNADVANNMGLLYYRRRDYAEAEKFLRRAVKLNPQASMAYSNLGDVLRDTDRADAAFSAYKESVRTNPMNADGWRGAGQAAFRLKREDDAINAFRKSLQLRPDVEKTWQYLLSALEHTNQLDEYGTALAEAKRRFPGTPPISLAEAKMLRRQKKYDEAIACLENHLRGVRDIEADCRVNTKFYCDFWSELAMLYDRVDNAEKAFENYQRGKDVMRLTVAYNSLDKDSVSREIAAMTAEMKTLEKMPATAVLPVSGSASQLVFLVGFPRSGTTLLDQILTSHPRITVAEEKAAVGKMAHYLLHRHGKAPAEIDHVAIRAALEDINADELAEMRRIFFAEHGPDAMKGRGEIFVDKLPLNILQAMLIKRVFPEAKFILALRHPCDSVFSCFMQFFDLNTSMIRFIDLDDSARFYAEAFDLWDLIRSKVDIESHSVYYEDVVSDFKPTIAALLEFLNVEWTDAVLDYDETARKRGRIHTPSYHQVTEKIYTRASGRWLRYKKQLSAILPVLRPYAEKHGYDGKEFD